VKADVGAIELLGVTRNGWLYYLPAGAQRNNVLRRRMECGRRPESRDRAIHQ
jgi:hypothetical protein